MEKRQIIACCASSFLLMPAVTAVHAQSGQNVALPGNAVGNPAVQSTNSENAEGRSDAPRAGQEVSFNSQFLRGGSQGADVSRFATGNPVMAGDYSLDVYVNDSWQGRQQFTFSGGEEGGDAHTCFTLEDLSGLGVKTAKLDVGDETSSEDCRRLGDWISQASVQVDTSKLRLDLSIPQSYMHRQARGYTDPSLWEPGINAGFLNYNFNARHSETDQAGGSTSATDTAYLSLNAGLNLGAWQFRHRSTVSRVDDQDTNLDAQDTFVRRPLPSLKSELLLGDSYTSGGIYDAVGFRGVNLSSDSRMLPDSLQGYAPTVRGTAQTNATVEIRQNGQLIYQTSVAPGPFVIDDLYPTSYGGDLEVSVIEADGTEQNFIVPFASVPAMLRPGSKRYNVTAGQVRSASSDQEPWFTRGTYRYGINNSLTGYSGVTVSEAYQSFVGGLALSTPVGAFSADVTHARSYFESFDDVQGESYKFTYSKRLADLGTNFTLAAFRYSTSGFLNLESSLNARDFEETGGNFDDLRRLKSQFRLTLDQRLSEGWGSLYFTGSTRNFWDAQGEVTQYQLGYNNRYKMLNYGLNIGKSENERGESDTTLTLSLSMPLDNIPGSPSLRTSTSTLNGEYDSSRIGLAGNAGEDGNVTYNLSVSNDAEGGSTGQFSGQYSSPYASFRGSYSQGDDFRQFGFGVTGSMVAHSGGVTLTPQRGETMVLVEAPEAKGARVTNSVGVRVDGDGYAVVPYVTPYRLNSVQLDPNGMSSDVGLLTSSKKVAPYAGAIAKLSFKTETGQAILIKAHNSSGEPLPFGADVYNAQQEPVGFVAQGGSIYLRTEKKQGTLTVDQGDESSCTLSYQVPEAPETEEDSSSAITHLEARCE
ncbi:fimbria/pilus outer membrane usher protein [Halomonas halmophila]|nr:fimbria/pilus outer membrane usher protein [Halomonas halmophila]